MINIHTTCLMVYSKLDSHNIILTGVLLHNTGKRAGFNRYLWPTPSIQKQILVPYPPENKPPSKISPLPSLTVKFLHRYVCLDYKPPSHQVECTRIYTCMRAQTYVRNPALQLTTSTKKRILLYSYGGGV